MTRWRQNILGLLATLLTALGPATAVAKLSEGCEAALRGSEPIERTVQPQYKSEIETAGRLYRAGETVGKLPTGSYLYLITREGNLIIAPKYDLESLRVFGKGLNTHKSLLNFLIKQLGETPEIVAAGQFNIAFGELVRLDNRSGNFRGGKERLPLATMILSQYGLAVNDETEIIVANPNDPAQSGHTPADRSMDDFQLQVLKEASASPRLSKFMKLYEELFQILAPSADKPTVLQVSFFLIDAAKAANNWHNISEFTLPFQGARSADGFAWSFWDFNQKIKKGQISRLHDLSYVAPAQIATLITGMKQKLSEEQVRKLKKISRDFKSLQPSGVH